MQQKNESRERTLPKGLLEKGIGSLVPALGVSKYGVKSPIVK